jgi:cysteine desulfurase
MSSNTSIYLDHAATTAMLPEAIAAYAEAAGAGPGNPSSLHAFGRAARSRVTAARDALAECLGCQPAEVVFTGSGTESDNAALFGAAEAQRARGRDGIVTTAVEHPAVLNACRRLQQRGFRLTLLQPDETGRVSAEDAARAIDDRTAVVSVMAGNNETGTRQPFEEIGEIARKRGAVMHVDAVQAFGYERWDMKRLPVDLLSASAHKIGGPQGVGLLYVRRGSPYEPLLVGGNQERARRAGTENVPGIAAFAAAARLTFSAMEHNIRRVEDVRSAFLAALSRELGEGAYRINGNERHRLPHIANISFAGISSEIMLMNLDLSGIAASGGSACSSGSLQPSHVLTAMNLPPERVQSAVRFSFGMGNTREEAEKTAQIIATISARVRIT